MRDRVDKKEILFVLPLADMAAILPVKPVAGLLVPAFGMLGHTIVNVTDDIGKQGVYNIKPLF